MTDLIIPAILGLAFLGGAAVIAHGIVTGLVGLFR